MEEWQTKRSGTPGTPQLSCVSAITTGFLDGTHPIVDAYELKVGPKFRGIACMPDCACGKTQLLDVLLH